MPEFKNVEVLNNWKGVQGDASTWTPREALLTVLKQIDSGALKAKAIVICIAEETLDPSAVSTIFQQSSPDMFVTLGLMEHIKAKILHGEDD